VSFANANQTSTADEVQNHIGKATLHSSISQSNNLI